MNHSRKVLIISQTFVYGLVFIISILCINGFVSYWDETQTKTILVASTTGLIAIWLTVILEKITDFRFSILVDSCIAADLFLSIIIGECCEGYYRIPYYDRVLHFIGTGQFAVLGYALFKIALRSTNKGIGQLALSLVFGFFFAVAVESMWELYEWAADCLFGTNMQKFVPPEMLPFLDENLVFPESMKDQIYEFYSKRDGYHYAIMDTMWDIVCDVLGAITFTIGNAVLMHQKPRYQDVIIYREKEEDVLRIINKNKEGE